MLGLTIVLNLAIVILGIWLIQKVKGVTGVVLRGVLAVASIIFNFRDGNVLMAGLSVAMLITSCGELAEIRKERQRYSAVLETEPIRADRRPIA